jgi:hypothetical protein
MLKRLFHEHPAQVGESYLEHMVFAFQFSGRLMRAGLAAFVHGLIPACCKTTASSEVLALHDAIRARRAQSAGDAVVRAVASKREVHSTI